MANPTEPQRISPLSRASLSDFKPKTVAAVKATVIEPAHEKEVAAKHNFTSRSSQATRRKRTGRVEQCNIKCTGDYKEKFHIIVDELKPQRIRGDAETFEFLIDFYIANKVRADRVGG